MASEFIKILTEDKNFVLALTGIALCAIGFLVVLGSHPLVGGSFLAVGGACVLKGISKMEASVSPR